MCVKHHLRTTTNLNGAPYAICFLRSLSREPNGQKITDPSHCGVFFSLTHARSV